MRGSKLESRVSFIVKCKAVLPQHFTSLDFWIEQCVAEAEIKFSFLRQHQRKQPTS